MLSTDVTPLERSASVPTPEPDDASTHQIKPLLMHSTSDPSNRRHIRKIPDLPVVNESNLQEPINTESNLEPSVTEEDDTWL